MFNAFDISASALVAQRIRMDTIATNVANANTFKADGTPYQRRVPIFAVGESEDNQSNPGVHVSEIVIDTRPGEKSYMPDHPFADEKGYVTMPNVNEMNEMVNAMAATRAYDANITVMNVTRSMADASLRLIA